jgi:UDP-N-acetylmuramate--alanine ligase
MGSIMFTAKNVHVIGIGGIGTSAAAKWWLAQGAVVTGSDAHQSELTNELEAKGVSINYGHATQNMPADCDLVIYSRAVPEANPERQVVKERGLIEWSYPQFLGELSKTHKTIAVSGTNGKSTTTAMVAKILIDAGFDPTVILGTRTNFLVEKNLQVGQGEWLVVEACEHMESMRLITPTIAVITNIEEDHLEYYGDLAHIRAAFKNWIDETKPMVAFGNARDEQTQGIANHFFNVAERTIENGKQSFSIVCDGPLASARLALSIPGEFNAMNAAAAAHAAFAAGVPVESIVDSLATFPGTWRRFEHVGRWQQADVYSDYAHHPTAIRGTSAAFKEFFPERRLVLVFEPHQHSRTKRLFDDFVGSFDLADVLILAEIYEVAGRNEEKDVSSRELAEQIQVRKKSQRIIYAADHQSAEASLREIVEPNDLVVIMGAGSIDELARKLTS